MNVSTKLKISIIKDTPLSQSALTAAIAGNNESKHQKIRKPIS